MALGVIDPGIKYPENILPSSLSLSLSYTHTHGYTCKHVCAHIMCTHMFASLCVSLHFLISGVISSTSWGLQSFDSHRNRVPHLPDHRKKSQIIISSEKAPEQGSKQAMSVCPLQTIPLFPNGSAVKNLPAMQETRVRSLGQEYRLAEEMATYSSILAWEIQCTEEPGGLLSMGSQSQTQLNVWVQHRIDHSWEHGYRIHSDDSLPNSWLWAHAVSS